MLLTTFELIASVQKDFAEKTFGPGLRTKGLVDHISKELKEIESDPTDADEWIDVLILTMSGLLRLGLSPQEIVFKYGEKVAKNMRRDWPDWRTADPDKAIEHVRGTHD